MLRFRVVRVVPTFRSVSGFASFASFALCALVPGAARADAREVAARVASEWRAAGAATTALPSRFVFDDETILVPIPAEEGAPSGCTHVSLIGARGMSFHARLSDAPFDPLVPEAGARASAHAGVLELRRCDPSRPVRHVFLTSDAGRGAVELVVGRSGSPLPSLGTIIPERTGGVLPQPPDPGGLPPLGLPERRAEGAEARAKREGATVRPRESATANDDGAGATDVTVEAGCHRVEVFARDPRADRPGRRLRLDVDAELRDPGEDRMLARDRTEAPDARLEACVGKATRLTVLFSGAPPGSDAIVTVASWPLPARLPPMWGPVTRSKMARVMFARHVAVPAYDPVFLAQGTSGTTTFPVPVEVGGCYVAVVGVTHGHARTLQLRTRVGARESTDERGAAEEAALTAFCVQAHEKVKVEVHGRGAGMGFGLAVFRVKSGVWESGR